MTEKDVYAKMIRIAMEKHKKDVNGVIAMLEELLPEQLTDSMRGDVDVRLFLSRMVGALMFLRAMKATAEDVDKILGPININETKLDA